MLRTLVFAAKLKAAQAAVEAIATPDRMRAVADGIRGAAAAVARGAGRVADAVEDAALRRDRTPAVRERS